VAHPSETQELYLLAEGELTLTSGGVVLESLKPGDHWGEGGVLGGMPAVCEARADVDCVFYTIPGSSLAQLPSVQWNLMESFDRRLKRLRSSFRFVWQPFYSVEIPVIDEQHRSLFALIENLAQCIERTGAMAACRQESAKLIEYTRYHFDFEIELLARASYPRLAEQRAEHVRLLEELVGMIEHPNPAQSPSEFFKDWLIDHTLLEDRRYRGVVIPAKE
jgi:hemerythrin